MRSWRGRGSWRAFLAQRREEDKQKTSDYLDARGKRAIRLMEEQEHDVKTMKRDKRHMKMDA